MHGRCTQMSVLSWTAAFELASSCMVGVKWTSVSACPLHCSFPPPSQFSPVPQSLPFAASLVLCGCLPAFRPTDPHADTDDRRQTTTERADYWTEETASSSQHLQFKSVIIPSSTQGRDLHPLSLGEPPDSHKAAASLERSREQRAASVARRSIWLSLLSRSIRFCSPSFHVVAPFTILSISHHRRPAPSESSRSSS